MNYDDMSDAGFLRLIADLLQEHCRGWIMPPVFDVGDYNRTSRFSPRLRKIAEFMEYHWPVSGMDNRIASIITASDSTESTQGVQYERRARIDAGMAYATEHYSDLLAKLGDCSAGDGLEQRLIDDVIRLTNRVAELERAKSLVELASGHEELRHE